MRPGQIWLNDETEMTLVIRAVCPPGEWEGFVDVGHPGFFRDRCRMERWRIEKDCRHVATLRGYMPQPGDVPLDEYNRLRAKQIA